jgi:hypothetical protein
MRSRLKNGIVSTRGNEGACPLVYSQTGSWDYYDKSGEKVLNFVRPALNWMAAWLHGCMVA